MNVKEAKKYIETLDDTIKNLQNLLLLSDEEQEDLAGKLSMNQTIKGVVNMSVNSIVSYQRILKDKIDKAKID